jgi:hypothetical protein
MRALISGATGLVGRELVRQLPDSAVLTRDPSRARQRLGDARAWRWSPEAEGPPPEALGAADVVFHLSGEPIADGWWTADKKRRIRESRVAGTRNLVAALGAQDRRPAVLVSASAVGYYGNRGDEPLDESAPRGEGFLADLCADWEREAMAAATLGMRVVCVRIGIVLSRSGGALAKMLPAFRLGVAGRLGDGRQWMPWIHLDDLVGLLVHAARDASLSGPVNGVAPNPVTNAEFTRTLAGVLHRPACLHAPAFALRLALGEMSGILLTSQRALPRAAERGGYAFRHPTLEAALRAALAAPAAAT